MNQPRTRIRSARLAALGALLLAALLPGSAAAATSTSFTTPGKYSFTVPSSVTGVRISATGAGGGSSATTISCVPGKGGNQQGTVPVTPGSTLSITVAGRGGSTTTATGGAGGFGGGASGGTAVSGGEGGGGGGGASSVTFAANPLVVGAGGGGCGAFSGTAGRGYGGNDGSPGVDGTHAKGGGAGTQTAGGTGGASGTTTDPPGGSGTAGQGGAGAGTHSQNGGGGGAGGGFFGGGGGGGVRSGQGEGGGGGGGSDHTAAGVSNAATTSGTNAGNGQVTITYFTVTPPAVSGKPEVGRTLFATPGTATGGSPTYQWLRGSGNTFTPIPGATGSTYKLGKADRGKRIEVRETVSDASGSASATSGPTGVVGPPLIKTSVKRTQRAVKQHGVVVKVKSNRAGTVTATGTIAVPNTAKTLRFKRVKRSLAANKTRKLKLRLSKKSFNTLKRALAVKGKLRARLTLVIKDKNGGRTTKKIRVTLKA